MIDCHRFASRKVGVLMKLRNMFTTWAKLKILISYIMPQITYCHTVGHYCQGRIAERWSKYKSIKKSQSAVLKKRLKQTRRKRQRGISQSWMTDLLAGNSERIPKNTKKRKLLVFECLEWVGSRTKCVASECIKSCILRWEKFIQWALGKS